MSLTLEQVTPFLEFLGSQGQDLDELLLLFQKYLKKAGKKAVEPAPKKGKVAKKESDEEPAAKKGSKTAEPAPKKGKASVDEEEEPAPKKGKTAKKTAPADDDDEEEPAPKKGGKKSKVEDKVCQYVIQGKDGKSRPCETLGKNQHQGKWYCGTEKAGHYKMVCAKDAKEAPSKTAKPKGVLRKVVARQQLNVARVAETDLWIDLESRILFDRDTKEAYGLLDDDDETILPLTDDNVRFLESHNVPIKEDTAVSKGKKGVATKASAKKASKDQDEEDEPVAKKSSKSKKGDDEEEAVAKSSKSKKADEPAPKKASKKEAEPAPKKGKASAKKTTKPAKVDDDESEEAPAKASAKKTSKSARVDDDDEELVPLQDDEDDDVLDLKEPEADEEDASADVNEEDEGVVEDHEDDEDASEASEA